MVPDAFTSLVCMTGIDWDGARRAGPVALGMTIEQVRAVLHGYCEADDRDDDLDDHEPNSYWMADDEGLIVTFRGGVATMITAKREFLVLGQNLIGMVASDAISLAGGETDREDWPPHDFIRTGSGLELAETNGRVVMVTVDAAADDALN
jgi:hypothetical protein